MIRHMTYFRVKRRTLGQAYERFLSDTLPAGGTILVVECGERWTTRVGHAAWSSRRSGRCHAEGESARWPARGGNPSAGAGCSTERRKAGSWA